MNKTMFLSCVFAAAIPVAAQAATVYPGCSAPAPKGSHHTFYVDPVKGSPSGDGSAAKPWRTLAEVVNQGNKFVSTQGHNQRTWSKGDTGLIAINPTAPIKAGDVIMLMSGNHGAISIFNNYNDDFITIMAAPGQTPIVSRLKIVSSGKWSFQGIKFQSERPSGYKGSDGLVDVGYGDWMGNTKDVVFDANSFSATDNIASWSPSDWMSKPFTYTAFFYQSASCVAVTNNHFYNMINGISAASPNSIVQGNLIEKMANDGIDMMASNLTIKDNTIKDGVNDAATSTLHADGIQGWSITAGGKTWVNKNVLVDSNTIIKVGASTKSYLQGISIFDGAWDNLTISNNVVVSNDYQGIALYGGTNSAIVNNTVIASDPTRGSWIMATKAKGGASANNVVVRNNISTALQVTSPGVTADHNIVASNMAIIMSDGRLARVTSGSYGLKNEVFPTITTQFITLNNATASYDLRPRSGSPALAFGIADKAPAVDIIGKARKPSVTVGAYN